MGNLEALKALYVALGGESATVADCVTNVEVLNAISALSNGETGAVLNSEAISNIAAAEDED